jgi:hypothetical protein
MNLPFNPEQKIYLERLKMDPLWASILKDIEKQCQQKPQYKRDDKDEVKKINEMIFNSGMDRQLDNVLALLGYER